MTPAEIPAELLAILDRAAGKQHTRTGSVVASLAAILTRYDELKAEAWHNEHVNPYFDDAQNRQANTTSRTSAPD